MNWFLVKYIYEIVCGEGKYNPQFDEQLRLMVATDKSNALQKAEAIAANFHAPFENCKGETVSWRFVCIADLHEISAPGDGVEITSTLHEPDDVNLFILQVGKRKDFLLKQMGVKEE